MDARVSRGPIGLHLQAAYAIPILLHFVNIQHGRQHFDLPQRKLRALTHKLAIDGDRGRTVKIKSIAIAAALIRVQVNAATLGRGILYEIYSFFHFSQLMMRAGAVRNDLNTVQSQLQVGT